MGTPDPLPRYRELPARPEAPPGSSWGVFGDDDQLGTLNLLTDARTLGAVREVRRGAVFPLGLPLDEPSPHLVWRTPPQHHLLKVGHEFRDGRPGGQDDPSHGVNDRDDYLDGLWLQGSSQWDGLTHIRHRRYGNYNGVPDDQIHGGPGTRLGVDQWAGRAVVGRALLIDAARRLPDYEPLSNRRITAADLDAVLRAQHVTIEPGDIVLLHTGWLQAFRDSAPDVRARLVQRGAYVAPGLDPSEEIVEYLWDRQVAAVACDAVGVEEPSGGFVLHERWLALLGMPIGEYWHLHDLAADCAAAGTYTALLVSVPLNVRGGVGSPPQAVAIR